MRLRSLAWLRKGTFENEQPNIKPFGKFKETSAKSRDNESESRGIWTYCLTSNGKGQNRHIYLKTPYRVLEDHYASLSPHTHPMDYIRDLFENEVWPLPIVG